MLTLCLFRYLFVMAVLTDIYIYIYTLYIVFYWYMCGSGWLNELSSWIT